MTNFKVVMLASGSKGNAAFVSTGAQCFLIDMGISCRAVVNGLKDLGVTPQDLDGIFITHEHIDHVRGLTTFTKKYKMPIYASEQTWRATLIVNNKIDRMCCRVIKEKVILGAVEITSFAVPHDAVDAHGYFFVHQGTQEKFTYLTDTGFVTDTVREAVLGAKTLVLEANHDVEMLKNGPYPLYLQQRILSTRGHLSNLSAAQFLAEQKVLPEQVILAHLSEKNNTPRLALETVQQKLAEQKRLQETEIFVAAQDHAVGNIDLVQSLF